MIQVNRRGMVFFLFCFFTFFLFLFIFGCQTSPKFCSSSETPVCLWWKIQPDAYVTVFTLFFCVVGRREGAQNAFRILTFTDGLKCKRKPQPENTCFYWNVWGVVVGDPGANLSVGAVFSLLPVRYRGMFLLLVQLQWRSSGVKMKTVSNISENVRISRSSKQNHKKKKRGYFFLAVFSIDVHVKTKRWNRSRFCTTQSRRVTARNVLG